MNDKCVVFNCTQECPLQWGYCNGKESGALRVLPLKMTENVPEDYTEILFVCLREDGCLELPATTVSAR